MMKRIAEFVVKYPKAVIAAIAVITLLLGAASSTLTRESDIKKLLPENSVSVRTYNEIDRKFGGADSLFIVVEDKNIFDFETLSKIREFGNALQQIAGVSRVISITNMDQIKGVPGGIEVSPLLEKIPRSRNELERFKRKVLSDDKYAGVFVSRSDPNLPFSEQTGAALILAKLHLERDESTVEDIRRLAQSFAGPEKFYLTGAPYITRVIMKGIAEDMIRLIPLVILLVALVLYAGFRKWHAVFLPLLSVLISTTWAMGLMALYGKPITVVSSAIPVLLISVGSAYGIHLIARFEEEDGSAPKDQIMIRAIDRTGVAIFIAAVTTAIGFSANMVSDISAIKTFGLITAFGIMSAFIVTLTFIPAAMKLIPSRIAEPAAGAKGTEGLDEEIGRILIGLSHIITKKRSWSLLLGLGLVLAAAFGYPRLSTETDPVRYFSKKSEVVRTAELVKEKFGGAVTLDILVQGDLKDPALLKKIDLFQQRLEKIKILGKPYSIIDALKETNRLMNNDNPRFERIPDSREGIAQYLLFLSLSGGEFTQSLITADQEEMLISTRVRTTRSTPIDRMVRQVNKEIKDIFPDDDGLEIKLSGMAVVMKDMREMLIANQIQSLALALVFVFLMILLIYRSYQGALVCMTPIFLTLILNFGIMGWFGIALDMATVMVASIAVGLGIDYSVHLFNRYKEERLNNRDREQSVDIALRAVGKPIIYNAASVAIGFIILLLSRFEILKNFGILVALTMLFSSFGALAILPEIIMLKLKAVELKRNIDTWKQRRY